MTTEVPQTAKPLKLSTEVLTPCNEEGMTIQILNKRTDLHYRHPRVSGLEEECRFLKYRVSTNVPQNAYIKVRGDLLSLRLPGPLWNLNQLLICSSRDSDAHSSLKTTVLSDDAKSIFTSNVQLLWLIPCWGAYSLQVQLFPTFDGSDHEKVLLRSELKCDLAHSSRSQLLCLLWEGPLESGIQKQAQT